METQKRGRFLKDPAWLAALGLLVGAFACGGGGGGISLGALVDALFTANTLRSAIDNSCESSGCDGGVADGTRAAVGVAFEGALPDTNYTVTVDGTDYIVTSGESPPTDTTILTLLAACITNGGASCTGGVPAQGSALVTAEVDAGPILDILSVDPYDSGVDITVGANLTDNPIDTENDLLAVAAFLNAFVYPSVADILTCAKGNDPGGGWATTDCSENDFIVPPDTGTKEVTFNIDQETDCQTGGISVLTTATFSIDTAGNFTAVEPQDIVHVIDFFNCTILGPFSINGVAGDATIQFDGRLVRRLHDVQTPSAGDPETDSFVGHLTLDGDLDGSLSTDSFNIWTENIDVRSLYTNDGSDLFNGGLCFNTNVDLGPDNEDEEDDGCTGTDGVFAPLSEYTTL